METTKRYLTWTNIHEYLNVLIETIDTSNVIKISGIPRGGLVPAVMLSHSLNIPYISYSAAKELTKEERTKVLVIDDICDSGYTVQEAQNYFFKTGTLTLRTGSVTSPDYVGGTIDNEDWIVFPWENKNSKTIQDYLV